MMYRYFAAAAELDFVHRTLERRLGWSGNRGSGSGSAVIFGRHGESVMFGNRDRGKDFVLQYGVHPKK